MALRFDDKVVVVTGAGGALGKAYSKAFAARGAKVVVSDLGGSTTGDGASSKAADVVVDEIKAAGGTAVADYNSVEAGDKIIESAIKAFGRIDILINNAGILRDTSFAKMTDKDWDLIDAVHIKGAYNCAKAAWPHMIKQQYGRIINVSSAAGLYGNFGQTNYAMAKSGLVGFTKSLAKEGERKNVLTNCIAPLAASRMTETVIPPAALEKLTPDMVVPAVLYMCHESSKVNSEVIEAGGGWYAAVRTQQAQGACLGGAVSVEDIEKAWSKITDFTDAAVPGGPGDSTMNAFQAMEKLSKL